MHKLRKILIEVQWQFNKTWLQQSFNLNENILACYVLKPSRVVEIFHLPVELGIAWTSTFTDNPTSLVRWSPRWSLTSSSELIDPSTINSKVSYSFSTLRPGQSLNGILLHLVSNELSPTNQNKLYFEHFQNSTNISKLYQIMEFIATNNKEN